MTTPFEYWQAILHEPPNGRLLGREQAKFRGSYDSGGSVNIRFVFHDAPGRPGSMPFYAMISDSQRAVITEVGVWVRTDCEELLTAAIQGVIIEPVISSCSYGEYPLWLLACEDYSVPMDHEDELECEHVLDRAAKVNIYVPQRQTVTVDVHGRSPDIDPLKDNEFLLQFFFEFRVCLRGFTEE